MIEVTLYGGPRHGQMLKVADGVRRLETPYLYDPNPPLYAQHELCMGSPYGTHTYYIRDFCRRGVTEAGSSVYKTIKVALFEDAALTDRDRFDVLCDLNKVPWEWYRKPNFLTEFDQWFEYTLAEIGWEQPRMRF